MNKNLLILYKCPSPCRPQSDGYISTMDRKVIKEMAVIGYEVDWTGFRHTTAEREICFRKIDIKLRH